ncbi:MAG: NADPH-dependent oxidoreductase, partial [Tissierellaceae bacterium]
MKKFNEMMQVQISHRTIREFTDEKLSDEQFEQLMEVARRTATSNGMQAASIIRVKDPEIKKKVSKVCNQEYISRATELLIFIVDQYRNSQIAREKNSTDECARDMDNFFSAFTDAILMAQNVVNAAESMGLGSFYMGSILNDTEEISKILDLPELTFPALGVALGYPNQDPQMKPRMEMKYRVFEDTYRKFDNYSEELKDYDEEMTTYYDLRDANRRVDSFSNQVVKKLK